MAKVPFIVMETENKSIKLKLGVAALKQLEEKTKKSVIDILNDYGNNLSITETVEIIHLAAQKYEHGFTVKDAENIVDDFIDESENGFMDLVMFVTKVFETAGFSMDAKKEEAEEEGKN